MSLRRLIATVLIVTMSLAGCGGGGDDPNQASTTPAPTPTPTPTTQPQGPTQTTTDKTSYLPNESISLGMASDKTTQAVQLTRSDTKETLSISLPATLGSIPAPVVPPSWAGVPLTLSFTSGDVQYRSNEITINYRAITTSQPGMAAMFYLQNSIGLMQSAIDELQTLDSTPGDDLTLLNRQLAFLAELQTAALSAQSGTPVALGDVDGKTIYVDSDTLKWLDQLVTAILEPSPAKQTAAAGVQAVKKPLALSDDFSIQRLDCSGVANPDDKAWCTNMQTQIAADLTTNWMGAAGTAVGAVLGGIAVLTGGAFVGTVAGLVAIAAIVYTNAVAINVKMSTASGTGTVNGISIKDNVKQIVDTLGQQFFASILKFLPASANISDLMKDFYNSIIDLAIDRIWDPLMDRINKALQAILNCTAQSSSGGQGSFVRRYDFGVARALTFFYNAYTVPDQFTVFDGNGVQQFGTGQLVSGTGSTTFTPATSVVIVKVTAPKQGTAWDYSLSCAQ